MAFRGMRFTADFTKIGRYAKVPVKDTDTHTDHNTVQHHTTQHSIAEHSTKQHSTAQR
jgi:hypothetical protein